jgi:hypothetical protein
MKPTRRPWHTAFYTPLLLCLILGSVCWVMAMPLLSPQREEMLVDRAPVTVEYVVSAGAEELGMPFYPEADVDDSFAYTVTAKEGSRVVSYAAATLISADPPDKVAAYYQEHLPGNPKPELLDDDAGERRVLAVANDDEVRQVTIAEHDGGACVQLVRSTRPVAPPRPVRPSGPDQRVI